MYLLKNNKKILLYQKRTLTVLQPNNNKYGYSVTN